MQNFIPLQLTTIYKFVIFELNLFNQDFLISHMDMEGRFLGKNTKYTYSITKYKYKNALINQLITIFSKVWQTTNLRIFLSWA